jgi:glycosyltransferase involved in cell wall biosynthesis
MSSTIAIVAPDIHAGDAVGNHCIYLAEDLNAAGCSTTLYAQRGTPLAAPVLPIDSLFEPDHAPDVLLVSYSILDPYLERLLALPQRKVCYFHGVTPSELLREHEPVTADLCARSIEQLPLLARFDRLVVNSRFNREDLSQHLDTSSAAVIPPISARLPLFRRTPVHPPVGAPLRILMLGRIVPHKRIEHGIQILAELRRRGLDVELDVVGSCHNAVYAAFLGDQARSLGVSDSVHMWGMLSDASVAERFASASVLLVASEHEGFCVPVLEAMHLGIPAVVRGGTAASEVGSPAVLDFCQVGQAAEHINRLLHDPALKDGMVKSGGFRATELLQQASVRTWQEILLGKAPETPGNTGATR